MRPVIAGLVASLLLICTAPSVRADDDQIAQDIRTALKLQQERGNLKDFNVRVRVEQGDVYMKGVVRQAQQRDLMLGIASRTRGVQQVINEVDLLATSGSVEKPVFRTEFQQGNDYQAPVNAAFFDKNGNTAVAQTSVSGKGPGKKRLLARALRKIRPQKRTNAERSNVKNSLRASRAGQSKNSAISQESANADPRLGVLKNNPVGSEGDFRQLALGPLPGSEAASLQTGNRGVPPLSGGSTEQRTGENLVKASPLGGNSEVKVIPFQTASRPSQRPRPFAPARSIAMRENVEGGYLGNPIPTTMPGAGPGAVPARFDNPNLPGYAWPSYAAYPNYAGLTYPNQYSANAWPYIGPFYPYPQVPLGWRKVTLEWDDGWWFLDFRSK
ncbi:MAG: hypothetical protein CMJ81_05590 [Planctomycetaceae bacterium]|nr:hypothetical protein [Planctomycetaceae bacterium]MBP61962.1 hypothetical protein [Planctomycetaceae bacterium]